MDNKKTYTRIRKEEYLTIQDGTGLFTAINLAPELEGEVAVVYLSVIKRLASYLPSSNFSEIKRNLEFLIDGASNLDELLDVIEGEYKFHKSVNRITSFKTEERSIGKIDLEQAHAETSEHLEH